MVQVSHHVALISPVVDSGDPGKQNFSSTQEPNVLLCPVAIFSDFVALYIVLKPVLPVKGVSGFGVNG